MILYLRNSFSEKVQVKGVLLVVGRSGLDGKGVGLEVNAGGRGILDLNLQHDERLALRPFNVRNLTTFTIKRGEKRNPGQVKRYTAYPMGENPENERPITRSLSKIGFAFGAPCFLFLDIEKQEGMWIYTKLHQ